MVRAREHDNLSYAEGYSPNLFYLVTLRSRGIDAESLLEGVYDPYVFFRDAYRQRRGYDIYDRQPPVELIEQMQGTHDDDVEDLLRAAGLRSSSARRRTATARRRAIGTGARQPPCCLGDRRKPRAR